MLNEKHEGILKCYAARSIYDCVLRKSSSGGIAFALAERILDQGGIVYGVEYSEDFCSARYARVSSKEDLHKLQGSKYIPSSKMCGGKLVSEVVLDDLKNDKKVLFTGLPCDVAALHKKLSLNGTGLQKNLLCVDLICHGPTKTEYARKYVERLQRKYKSRIVDFSVRYKNPNCYPPYLYALFENGKVFLKPFYETEYGIAFINSSLPCSFKCKFKGNNHYSDMTIGDYGDINDKNNIYNSLGVSMVIVHTEKANKILNSMDSILLSEVSIDEALESNQYYYKQRKKPVFSSRFERIYAHFGLEIACFFCRSFKDNIKAVFPQKIIQSVKKLVRH